VNKKVLQALKLLLFISIGLLLVWLSIRGLDEETKKQTVEAFKKANYTWVFLSIVVGILSHWSRAVRWNMLMQPLGHSPRTSNTFFAVMVGYLANYAFPRLGEVTRCSLVSRYEKVPLNEALGTVVAERIIDVITMLTLFVLTLLLNANKLFDIVDEQIFSPIRDNWGQKADLLIGLGVGSAIGLILFFLFWKKIKVKIGSKAQKLID
jgi:glycosyltransferase 2 family protein